MLFSMGCVPHIYLPNLPTRITTKSSTLLDHIYTNFVVSNIKSYILLHDITDHFLICSTITELKPYVTVETAYFRNIINLIVEQHLHDLQTELTDMINADLENKIQMHKLLNLQTSSLIYLIGMLLHKKMVHKT